MMQASVAKHCVWPAESPPSCPNNCKRFFEGHTARLSFALYSDQKSPNKICVYSFVCGNSLNGHHEIEPTETLSDTLQIVIKEHLELHQQFAMREKELYEICTQ